MKSNSLHTKRQSWFESSRSFSFPQLHGTYRQRDRVYHEDVFWGNGKALDEATPDELAQDIKERINENPFAYQGNELVNALSQEEIEQIGGKNNKKNE